MNSLEIKIKEANGLTAFAEKEGNTFAQTWNKIAFSIGIRKKLSDPELGIILEFMQEFYKTLTLKDVSKAFGLYTANRLDFNDSHYQSLDNLFIGKVLDSFKEWQRKENAKPKPIEPAKQLAEPKEDFKAHFDFVKRIWESESQLPKMFNVKGLFVWMEDQGMIKLSDPEKVEIFEQVKAETEAQIKNERAKMRPINDLMKDLEKSNLQNEARRRCIRNYFKGKSIE